MMYRVIENGWLSCSVTKASSDPETVLSNLLQLTSVNLVCFTLIFEMKTCTYHSFTSHNFCTPHHFELAAHN